MGHMLSLFVMSEDRECQAQIASVHGCVFARDLTESGNVNKVLSVSIMLTQMMLGL